MAKLVARTGRAAPLMRRQAGVAIIEYIVLGAVLVLGMVYGVSQFRDSAASGAETVGVEVASVAAGDSLAERYSGSAGPGSAGPSGGGQTPGGGQAPAGGTSAGGPADPIEVGNGPKDEDRGPAYLRGPHYEGGLTDEDGDGTRDTARIEGSLARGHAEGHYGVIGGDIDAELVYGEAQAGSHFNYGGSANANAEVGVARGEAGINFGSEESPIARVEGDGSVLSAGAGGDLLLGDDGRRVGFGANGNASASLAEGRAGGGFEIPIPFTGWSIGWGGGVSGGAGSVGGNAGAHGYYDREDGRVHWGGNLGIDAILGVGLDSDFSIGTRTKKKKK